MSAAAVVSGAIFDGPVPFAVGAAPNASGRHGLTTCAPRPGLVGPALHEAVRVSGLTGRGGGHFPVASKWDAALADGGPHGNGVLVINAAEGEPASAKDAALLHLRPDLVAAGATATAQTLGLREVLLWSHLELAGIARLQAPQAYVSGETSAVIAAVKAHRAGDRATALPFAVADPARPWGTGERIVVHNAETLARVALIASGHKVNSVLLTIARAQTHDVVDRTVIEMPYTASLLDAITAVDSDYPTSPTPVLLGGYGGTWIPADVVPTLTLDPAGLVARGLSLGAGVVLLPPRDVSLAAYVADLADYLAGESAGQCGPCLFGLRALATRMDRTARSPRRSDRLSTDETLIRLLDLVDGRGACKHPDGVVRMVRSAVAVISATGTPSGAARAPARVPVRIDRTRCTGVGICARVAPEAIALDPWGYPLVDAAVTIDEARLDRAIRACPRGALSRA